jgi:hypothetical protein
VGVPRQGLVDGVAAESAEVFLGDDAGADALPDPAGVTEVGSAHYRRTPSIATCVARFRRLVESVCLLAVVVTVMDAVASCCRVVMSSWIVMGSVCLSTRGVGAR